MTDTSASSVDSDRPRPALPLHVVLVEPDIPWNAGNAGRTCLATGAQLHLIRPLGFSLDNRHLKRAGLDYWPFVRPVVWPHWSAFAAALPQLGAAFFFSAEGERDLWSVTYPQPSVLLFGSETGGLPADLRQAHRERLLALPQVRGPVRSLNVSTVVGVAVYEVLRQWRGSARPEHGHAQPEKPIRSLGG